MFKPMNKKQIAKFESKMIQQAQEWKTKFFANDPEKLAEAIWNKYGYPVQVKNGKVQIWARHQVIAEV